MTYDNLKTLLERDRSYRRFDAAVKVNHDTLLELVDLVRYCGSGRNLQPLKYRLVCTDDECAKVYPTLAWAGYFKDWDGPEPAERPTAYLVQCLDESLAKNCLCDDGLQLEAITLGAVTLGLGCCIIKAFNAPALAEALRLPAGMTPRYVLAIGKPVEECVIVDMDGSPDASFVYWRDENAVHHVPKRPLDELIIR